MPVEIIMRKEITLKSENITLRGQLFTPDSGGKLPAVCVCHGIPSGKTSPVSAGYPELAEMLCRQGFVALIFNFRGTGASEGNFDIAGWAKDLQSTIDYLWSESPVDRKRIYLLGFSAGAAVSIYVASQDRRIAAVASCASPADFEISPDKMQATLGYFRNLGIIRDENFPESVDSWFAGFSQVRPEDCVDKISPRPLLVINSRNDEVVPVSHAYRLYEKACEPKKLVILEGNDHRLRLNEEAMSVVIDWVKTRESASST
ncbi:alpha/beta hydrolase [Chloroflexota bacterium]